MLKTEVKETAKMIASNQSILPPIRCLTNVQLAIAETAAASVGKSALSPIDAVPSYLTVLKTIAHKGT